MKPYAILLEVDAAGRCVAEIRTNAPGLTHLSVLPAVLAFAQRLSATPGAPVETMAEMAAKAKRAELERDHPAKRLYTRDGAQLWLGEAAVAAVGAALVERGWMDVGDVPADVVKVCERALNEAAFDTLYL